jgi:hypothetical protein
MLIFFSDFRRGQEAIARYRDQGFKVVPLEYSLTGIVPLQKHWRQLENVVHSGSDQPRRTTRMSLAKDALLQSGGDITFKRTLTIEVIFIEPMDYIELSNADLTLFKNETRIKVKNAPNVAVALVDVRFDSSKNRGLLRYTVSNEAHAGTQNF